jgi:hypothetical protein
MVRKVSRNRNRKAGKEGRNEITSLLVLVKVSVKTKQNY